VGLADTFVATRCVKGMVFSALAASRCRDELRSPNHQPVTPVERSLAYAQGPDQGGVRAVHTRSRFRGR
jgi:hypothetical protein